jgi:hypothetical protein
MGDAASAAAAASAAFPRAAKTLAAALLCGYALCLLPPVAWVLPLVPGKCAPNFGGSAAAAARAAEHATFKPCWLRFALTLPAPAPERCRACGCC